MNLFINLWLRVTTGSGMTMCLGDVQEVHRDGHGSVSIGPTGPGLTASVTFQGKPPSCRPLADPRPLGAAAPLSLAAAGRH